MAEDKSKTVIVKARAKAFLTSKPEESDPLITEPVRRRTSHKQQKSAHSAAEIAAAIRKGEKSEKGKNTAESPAADTKKSTAAVIIVRQEPVINRKNKLTEGGRVKKLPACKMAEPMKRPADDTLIITGKVVAASKKIQTPVEAAKPAAVKTEEVKVVKPAAEQPAAKKEEPKKTAAPAAKKAEPKKAAAKPAAKKAELVKNTYIQYQNDTYNEADLTASAEKLWTKDMKRKAADLKTLELYVKPQEKMVYCVFNKKETGSFAI